MWDCVVVGLQAFKWLLKTSLVNCHKSSFGVGLLFVVYVSNRTRSLYEFSDGHQQLMAVLMSMLSPWIHDWEYVWFDVKKDIQLVQTYRFELVELRHLRVCNSAQLGRPDHLTSSSMATT